MDESKNIFTLFNELQSENKINCGEKCNLEDDRLNVFIDEYKQVYDGIKLLGENLVRTKDTLLPQLILTLYGIELGLKLLLYKNGSYYGKVHNIDKLFIKLDEDNKNKIFLNFQKYAERALQETRRFTDDNIKQSLQNTGLNALMCDMKDYPDFTTFRYLNEKIGNNLYTFGGRIDCLYYAIKDSICCSIKSKT